MGVGERLPEHDLRHVVAAGAELVEDLALRDEALLLEPVQRPADLDEIGDAAPVEVGVGRVGLRAFRGREPARQPFIFSTTAAAKRSTLSSDRPTTLKRPLPAM